MATRKSGPLDAMVGTRISMLRVNRGMSQAMLAERIGVTFQQMQKYERGANRVGASLLSRVASVLGVSVGALFESSQAESPGLNSSKLVESIASRTPGAKATVVLFNAVGRGGRRKFPREDSLPQEDERQSRAVP